MSNAVKYDIQEGDWHFLFKTIKRHLPVNMRRDIRCDIFFRPSHSILFTFTTRRSDRSNTKPINLGKTIPTTHPIVCLYSMTVPLFGPCATDRSQQTTARCRVVWAMTSFHVPFFGWSCGMALGLIVGTSQFGVTPRQPGWRDCMTRHESFVALAGKSVLTICCVNCDRRGAIDLYVFYINTDMWKYVILVC